MTSQTYLSYFVFHSFSSFLSLVFVIVVLPMKIELHFAQIYKSSSLDCQPGHVKPF